MVHVSASHSLILLFLAVTVSGLRQGSCDHDDAVVCPIQGPHAMILSGITNGGRQRGHVSVKTFTLEWKPGKLSLDRMVISTVCDQPRGKPATPHMPLADSQGERRSKHIRPAARMTMDAAHVHQHHKQNQNIGCRLLVMLFVVSCNQYLPVIPHLRFQHVSKLTADGSRDRNSNDDEVKVYFRTLYAIFARIDCRP